MSMQQWNMHEAQAFAQIWRQGTEGIQGRTSLPLNSVQHRVCRTFETEDFAMDPQARLLQSDRALCCTALAITLWKYNWGLEEIVFGLQLRGTVYPLRVTIKPGMTVEEVQAQVAEMLEGYAEFAAYAMSHVMGCKNTLADLYSAIDCTLSFEEPQERHRFMLQLRPDDTGAGGIRATYGVEQLNAATVERLVGHYAQVLSQASAYPQRTVAEVDLLMPMEREQLLRHFNPPYVEADPEAVPVQLLFERQVAQTPHHTAVIFHGVPLTYEEVNRRANRLAHYLRQRGVHTEDKVGIMLERSHDMIIGVLGILKAGGAYVPIDPAFPQERCAYMLRNSGAVMAISEQSCCGKLEQLTTVIRLDDAAIAQCSSDNPAIVNHARQLAYVIYTSGSTGTPKGVMVEHSQIYSLLDWMQGEFRLQAGEWSVHRTNLTFDPSVWEMLWPLCTGGTVLLLTKEQGMDAHYLLSLMKENERIKMLFLPSSLVKTILYLLENQERDATITMPLYHFGAEPISMEVLKKSYAYLNGRIINTYGPTECTVFNTYYYVDRDDPRDIVPIGKPIRNNALYVLSPELELMPIRAVGEICIAGSNVSRGYIHDSERTAEKFVANPFGPGRLYRTGDLGRWLEDGNIEIIGRADNQVKIRGRRIEPSEIELAFIRYEGIHDCKVLVNGEEESKQLVAYVVLNEGAALSGLQLHLGRELPEYLIPPVIRILPRIPLTVNGKVDYAALAAIDKQDATEHEDRPSAEQEVEELGVIWFVIQTLAALLKLERPIRKDQSLTELGMNSLTFARMMAEIACEYPFDVDGVDATYDKFSTPNDVVSYIMRRMQQEGERTAI